MMSTHSIRSNHDYNMILCQNQNAWTGKYVFKLKLLLTQPIKNYFKYNYYVSTLRHHVMYSHF